MITRTNRLTKATITMGNGDEIGLDGGEEYPWWTICDTHGETCCHPFKKYALAHMAWPEWCSECREIMREKGCFE